MACLIIFQLTRCFNERSIRHNRPVNMPDTMNFFGEFAEKVIPNTI